ncbi:uncharacterized protein LOC115704067 [Cannabis sativa]|uniref:uncharacterized protein LOC115704067 n=1 Tax=Cannabis sativa TaxID=3483 RepID=UPI0011DFA78C|nr:uncharacterized protein LOC115704067 [Cannabis sativa]
MSWLINSVSSEIAQSIMYYELATKTWNDLPERFNEGNGPWIFQLQTQLTRLQQGDYSVSAYFTKMKSLWDELKEFQPITTCTCGAMKIFLDYFNQNQVLQFLTGLNESYASVRAQILLNEPIPNLSRVFAMIVQGEHQRSLGSSNAIPLAGFAPQSVNADLSSECQHLISLLSNNSASYATSSIVDSGATHHMCSNFACFSSFTNVPFPKYVTLPNGQEIPVQNVGTIKINSKITLHNDPTLNVVIGTAERCGKLYLLQQDNSSTTAATTSLFSFNKTNASSNTILVWKDHNKIWLLKENTTTY